MPKIEIQNDLIVYSTATGTDTLQAAINQAIAAQKPLYIGPGSYSVTSLRIDDKIKIFAMKGSVTISSSGANCFYITVQSGVSGSRISDVSIEGIGFDGENKPFVTSVARPGLIRCVNADRLMIKDCIISRSDRAGVDLIQSAGVISGNEFYDCRTSIYSNKSLGIDVYGNYIRDSKDNGIVIWRADQAFDGTRIGRNRIYGVQNETGGSGEFGNGIFVYQSNSVTSFGNVITGCNYSALRYSQSSNAVISSNQISSMRETAIFVEAPDDSAAPYEGMVVSNNTIFDAGEGIKIVNSNLGSRRSTISANVLKNISQKIFVQWASPSRDPATQYTVTTPGNGITVSSDAAICANTIESCGFAGIALTIAGTYNSTTGVVRDQNTIAALANGNIIKNCPVGVGYSDDDPRGYAEVSGNVIIGASSAAITRVNVTNLPNVPNNPNNGFGPLVRRPGAPDVGGNADPITTRFSFFRNKVIPKTV
ncbi:TIGR03808 family TAT-translocated repetitive protein [Methylobacterium sp. SD274]|uniref:TIGR03808 family TAT-translocated repetitive protein n=1 Tax=Methylobacterium sp. SD274 TaxID=2782009 RepID=UPI001A97A118|nr:TIGR03808 family TAT-translocated repetitive protein [Methylobacterium sp. SD274]MBO1021958.1 TIGR03808 family TAT-translocated repetitive protein [Methylobacterium sp. SD274]